MATTTLKHSFYYYIGLARNGPQVCTILKFVEVHLPNKVLCTQHETSLRCTTQEQVLSSQKGFWIQSIVSHGVRTDRAVTSAMNKARCNAMDRSIILKRLDSTRLGLTPAFGPNYRSGNRVIGAGSSSSGNWDTMIDRTATMREKYPIQFCR